MYFLLNKTLKIIYISEYYFQDVPLCKIKFSGQFQISDLVYFKLCEGMFYTIKSPTIKYKKDHNYLDSVIEIHNYKDDISDKMFIKLQGSLKAFQ